MPSLHLTLTLIPEKEPEMLIHICPRFLTWNDDIPVRLVDVTVDALGVVLRDGVDLVMRQPYPNKRYYVACRKVGRKAINGLILDTGMGRLMEFEVVTRWAVFASDVVTHHVQHVVLDKEFDAVSTDMVLWYAMCAGLGGWDCRAPRLPEGVCPASHMPRMAIMPTDREHRTGNVVDVVNRRGMITERREVFSLPTIQPERLRNFRLDDRLPRVEDIFNVGHSGTQPK
jgi:hypothetical protein